MTIPRQIIRINHLIIHIMQITEETKKTIITIATLIGEAIAEKVKRLIEETFQEKWYLIPLFPKAETPLLNGIGSTQAGCVQPLHLPVRSFL